MNKSQIRNQRIRTYKINKISLSYFDDKIYILDNGIVRVRVEVRVEYQTKVTLMTERNSFFGKL